jgi:hypothetical protein
MREPLSERLANVLLKESFEEGEVVYISTANWQQLWSSNRGLHRFPSDEIMEKLKPYYVNKSLGKVTKVLDNGYNVKFGEQIFFMKDEFLSLLSGKKTQ